MENTANKISTENYYSTKTGLNVELPTSMNRIDREIRYNDLNRAISDEDRATYFGKVIPLAEQDRILKSYKPKKEGAINSFSSNAIKSSYNTFQDILTAPYEWLIQKGAVGGVALAELTAKAKGLPVTDKDKGEAVLETMEALNPDYDATKFKLEEQQRWSAGWWGQGAGSISSAILAAIATGNVTPISISFGAMSDKEVTKARLERGDSLLMANARGGASGTGVALLESLHFNKVVSRVVAPRLQRYAARFVTGSVVETSQDVVESVAKGDADTRTKEQKMEALIQNVVFGGFGDVLGHISRDIATRKEQKKIKSKAKELGVDDTSATEIAQVTMVDEKPNLDKLRKDVNERQNKRRSDLYDAFIEQGDSPEVAGAKANELVPTYEEVESEIRDDLQNGKILSDKDIEKLANDFDEATSVGGDEAESYIKAKDELKQKLVNAGVEEEQADKEARMFTGIVVNGYQAYKDTERALGREPTKSFDEVKEESYKLNSVINRSIDDTNEVWAEYDARNQTMSEEEKEFFAEKPSHKLYSISDGETDFVEFKGNPEGAIEKLLSEKKGYVSGAIYKEGIGDIDFIYGKTGKGGYGLAHILERRSNENIDKEDFVRKIPDIIRRGVVYDRIDMKDRSFIIINDREAIIRLDSNGEKRNWLLTAYMKKSKGMPTLQTSGQNLQGLQISNPNLAMADNITPSNENVNSKLYSQTQGNILGSYDPVAREVELFKGQNPSTLTHELGHHFLLSHLRLMESMGLKDRNSPVFEWLSKVVGRDINSVRDMDEIEGDVINPHEALVEAFISYMNNGEAPNLVTENIFKRAKNWLLDRFRVHKTEASTEIRDYFDSIIARDETIPDMSGLTTRTREIAEILKQAKNGEQVSFKGLGKKELKELQKAFHSIVRRKGRSLRDMIIERGGIKEGTELAKSLGFDVLKEDKMYTTKDTAFDNEAELIDWLAEEGLIVGVQEGEDYSATERRWEDVQRLIDNAENTYTVRESLINQERETALANRAYVQEIVDELLKDNELGLKDINDLDDLLSKIVSRKDDVDITKVNSNAIKYLNERVKGLNKEIKALERNKNKEFKNKREEQYLAQNDLKDFIRGLPINNQHKVALMGNIQRVKDYDSLAQIVNDLKPRIKGYIEQEAKHLMRNNINNILIKSKPRERKKQNFNYDYNKLFEELREYNKLTQEQATQKLNEFLDKGLSKGRDKDGGEVLSEITEQDRVKNMLLQYKAKGMDTSIDLLKKLSDELSAIYNDAINDKMESDIAKAEQREEKIKGIVNYIENTKAVNKLNQKLLKMTNLNSNLSELFGKKWADEHKMDSYLIKQDIETNKALDEAIRVGKDIYKLKDREELIKLMNDMRIPKEEYTLNNYRDDFSQPISKMQLIDIYLTIKNKGSKEAYNRLYEDFDEEGNQTTTQIEDLLSNLTEEDKKFGDMLQKRVNDLYDAENKVYVKLYGIDMPKHENYWMRSSDPSERELMDVKQFMNLDMLPSFMKERAKAPSVYPDDAFKKFARRMHDSKYMTEVFEHYKDLYDTIHSNRVKKAIVKKYDDKRYQALNQSLKRISLGGVNGGYSELNNILGKAVTNWVVSKISLSETVFVKQLASFTNYAENVPVTDFVKYQAEFWANPKKAIDFMKEFAGEYLDHRFKSGIQNEVLKRIMTSAPEDYSKATGIYQKYLNLVTLPVRFGDIGAIYIGGYARAKYLVDQGVPLEKARKMFIEETESAQQSGNKAELSEFQEDPLWRVFTAFKNTNLQYMRKMQDSYIQYTRGEIDAKQFGKIWGNYMVVQSILYQVLTNIGTWWRDDDDEELQPMKDVWMRILTSPVAGFPIIGDITEGIFAENYWGLNISGKQDMEAFIGGARDVLNGKFDPKKIAKGSVALTSFFRPMPDRIIKGVINLIEE